MSERGSVLVVGAGDATGGAVARRFAREGLIACVARRHESELSTLVEAIRAQGGRAEPFGVDTRDEDQVVSLLETIERDLAPIEVAVYNVGSLVRTSVVETTSRVFRSAWEATCFGGFLVGREAARHMLTRGRGTILFTGATASLRGGNGFAAFAAGKHGLRALSQSMARELGPKGIHVAHAVIDGMIDTPSLGVKFPDALALKGGAGLVNPDDIADAYWQLHVQPRSAWTQELDLRPWSEKF